MFYYAFIIILLSSVLFSGCRREQEFVDQHNKMIDNTAVFEQLQDMLIPTAPINQETSKRANINTKDISLRGLVELLDNVYAENISVTASDNIKITLNLHDVSLSDVMRQLILVYNLNCTKHQNGYTISGSDVATKIFHVNYHNLKRVGNSTIAVNNNSPNIGGQSTTTSSNATAQISTLTEDTFWSNIYETLNVILQDTPNNTSTATPQQPFFGGGGMSYTNNPKLFSNTLAINKESGTIVVRGTPRPLMMIGEFLDKINNMSTKQVLIEAKILEVTLYDAYSSGINWSLIDNYLDNDTSHSQHSAILSQNHTSQLYNNDNLMASPFSIRSPSVGNVSEYFSGLIKLLSSQGRVSVLSSPKISVLNNQRAIIKFGQDSTFLTGMSTSNTIGLTGTSNTTGISNFSTQVFFEGIALDTTPNIINDNEVILHIHPMITRLDVQAQTVKVNGIDSTIRIPNISSRETDTVVKANSGAVVILGGLIHDTTESDSSGLPTRSKVGRWLKGKVFSSEKTELIILLRPIIVNSLEYQHDGSKFKTDIEKF